MISANVIPFPARHVRLPSAAGDAICTPEFCGEPDIDELLEAAFVLGARVAAGQGGDDHLARIQAATARLRRRIGR